MRSPSPGPPTAQEIVADHRLAHHTADPTAQLANLARIRGCGSASHRRLAFPCRDRRRPPGPAATVMRHCPALALPIGLLTMGVPLPTPTCPLVALSSRPQTPTTRPLTARPRAVPLPPVAPRADVDRPSTPIAHKTAAIRTRHQGPDPPQAWTSTPSSRDTRHPWGTTQAFPAAGASLQRCAPAGSSFSQPHPPPVARHARR